MIKKLIASTILFLSLTTNILANQKCKDLPGFKTLGMNSIEYVKCLAKKSKDVTTKELKSGGKIKLNTDSKLTDWIKKNF